MENEIRATERQLEAYQRCSSHFEGLSKHEAAKQMGISVSALNRLLQRFFKNQPNALPLYMDAAIEVPYEEWMDSIVVEKF